MGRKKRPTAQGGTDVEVAAVPPSFPAAAMFDPYGRPLPPPMPPPEIPEEYPDDDSPPSKKSRENEEESYLVKKYRPDSYYRSIEAFAKYTKSHRMFDATYVRWTDGGETADKPNVFGIRISGTFLSWGRGKTRDAAIDASIRAAFALVAAHGYDDFTLTDDCFTEEPTASNLLAPMPPPPPPPPLPPGVLPPPLPPGMPPMHPGFALPPGLPPNFAVPPPASDVLIPQPAAFTSELAVASSVGGGSGLSSVTAIGANASKPISLGTANSEAPKKTNNSKLVFSGEEIDDSGEELSMEEVRMRVPRYWNLVLRALANRNEEAIGE